MSGWPVAWLLLLGACQGPVDHETIVEATLSPGSRPLEALFDPGPERRAVLAVRPVAIDPSTRATLVVTAPGSAAQRFALYPPGRPARFAVVIPAGATRLAVAVDAGVPHGPAGGRTILSARLSIPASPARP